MLLGYFAFYSFTKHYITSEEIENFEKENSYISGDWYYSDKSKTQLFKLHINDVSAHSNFDMSNQGMMNGTFSYIIYNSGNMDLGSGVIDTNMYYTAKIELPLNFSSGLKILDFNGNRLNTRLRKNTHGRKKNCQPHRPKQGNFHKFHGLDYKAIYESKFRNSNNHPYTP